MVYDQGLEFESLIDIWENNTMNYMAMNWIELTHVHNLFLSHKKMTTFCVLGTVIHIIYSIFMRILQPCEIDIGLKEHPNRVYLSSRPRLWEVCQGFSLLIQVQPRKYFNTQTLPINYAIHTTTQLFSKSQLFWKLF